LNLFRVYVYFTSDTKTVKLTSESVEGEFLASRVLDTLLALPGVTGGGLEERVPDIGWVLYI
jgi:hypothetical protein